MIRASLRQGLPLVAAALLLIPVLNAQESGRGRKYKPPPPTCKVSVTVVKASDGKPVENAAVVFHPIRNNKDEGNMELKTNEEGKTTIDVIPIGDTVRVQVIAEGFQTFGNDYPLPGDSKDIVIKLRRPVKQYSIYQNGSGDSGNQNGSSGTQQQNGQKPPQ